MNHSVEYASLTDFLDDLATNPKFAYAVEAFARQKDDGWIGVEAALGSETEAGMMLHELAFERMDTPVFSACNLKVRYLFDEDFVNDGSALLVFNLVATPWVHLVWLRDQNKVIASGSTVNQLDCEQARSRVHIFLRRNIEINHCPEPPENVNLYEFNPAREHLFTFKLFGHDSVGSSEFMAVDRESGEVRYLGFHAE